jgi:Leucine-rich repeat (LRR) protein
MDLRMNRNKLHGPIPDSIGDLQNLTHIIINGNDLRGTLPVSLGKLKHLTILDVSLNYLHGTIPAELGNLERMKYLYLSHNALHGSLPPQLGNLTNLLEFQVSVNRLTGTIPETFAKWSNIQFFEVAFNRLKGTIPEYLTSMQSLDYLFMNHNKFEGSLPFFHSPRLLAIAVQSNRLEGSLQVACDHLSSLDLSRNEFVGTFPWQNISNTIVYLNISRNNFVGTIPSMHGEAFRGLTYLDISQNELSGTLPACFQHSPNLSVFQAADNAFHGSLDALFQLSVQRHLTFIDISQNQFTGTLPESFFQFVNITSVSAASNCLNHAIPTSICSAPLLSTVVLDGMGSGDDCSHRSEWSQSGPALPVCAFDLPQLRTLHLSGLGLTGSLPAISSVPNSLQALSLSHNQLSGSIPPAIVQHQSWVALDLSFNRLSGSLPSLVMSPSEYEDVSLSVQLNHLSGRIPSSLLTLASIDILDGNLFTCGLTQSERHRDLPNNDGNAESYSCGSNEVDLIIYVWLGSFVVCLIGGIGGIKLRNSGMSWSEMAHLSDSWWVVNRKWMAHDAVTVFVDLATNWLRLLTATMCILLLLCLPVFASLKQRYGTYEDQYMWTLSACLMEGAVPTVVLFIIMTGCICFFYYAMRRQHFPRIGIPSYRKSTKKWMGGAASSSPVATIPTATRIVTSASTTVASDKRTGVIEEEDKETAKELSWSQLRWFLVASVALSAVVVVVNASYVYLLQRNVKQDDLTAMALLVSFVKVSSNQVGLSFAAKLPSHATLTMWLIAFFSFNNVVVPYLMESFISTSCFRYTTLQSPPMVSSSVKMPMCLTVTNPIPYIDNTGE